MTRCTVVWAAALAAVVVSGCTDGRPRAVEASAATGPDGPVLYGVPSVVPTEALVPGDPRTCVSTEVRWANGGTRDTTYRVTLYTYQSNTTIPLTVSYFSDPWCATAMIPAVDSGLPTVELAAGQPSSGRISFRATGAEGAQADLIAGVYPSDPALHDIGIRITVGLRHTVVFTQQPPSSVGAGQSFPIAFTVKDWYGNPVDEYVSLAAFDLVTAVGTIAASPSVPVVNGAAALDVSFPWATPRAALVVMESAEYFPSAVFAVLPGSPAVIEVSPEPILAVTAGDPIAVSARVLDAAVPPNPVFATTVSVSLATAGTLVGGTERRTDDLGVADFGGIAITTAGTHALRFRSGGVEVDTAPFDVSPGPAAPSFVAGPPASVVAGAAFGASVRLADRYGNVVPGTPRLSLVATNGATNGATLDGAAESTTAAGVTTWSALRIASAGTYALEAAWDVAGTTTTARSGTFTVAAGAPASLRFVDFQTTTGSVGFALQPAIQVELVDAAGNLATGSTDWVTLSTTPASTLSGTPSVQPSNGVATFSNVVPGGTGSFTLVATQGALRVEAPASTVVYTVGSSKAADHLAWVTPPRTLAVGECSGAIAVEIDDVDGARVSLSAPVALALGAADGLTYYPDTSCQAAPITSASFGLAGIAQFHVRASAPGIYSLAVQANLSGINASTAGTRSVVQTLTVGGAAPAPAEPDAKPLNGWSTGCGAAGGAPSSAALLALLAVALRRRRGRALAALLVVAIAGSAIAAPPVARKATAARPSTAPAAPPPAAPAPAPAPAPATAPATMAIPLPPPPELAPKRQRPRDARPALAVLTVEATGAGPAVDVAALTDVLASALDAPRWFRVVSARDVMAALALERQKELLGCSADQGCLAELAGALGVDYVAAASVGRVGDGHVVSGRILEARRGVAVARVSSTAEDDGLVAAVSDAGRSLLEGYRAGRSAGEQAALVFPEQVGRRPVTRGPLALRAGAVFAYAPGADEGARGSVGVEAGIAWRLDRSWSLVLAGVGGPNAGFRAGAFRALTGGPVRVSLGLRGAGWPGAGAYGGGPAIEAAVALGRSVDLVGTLAGEGYAAEARYGSFAALGGLGVALKL